MAEPRQGEVWWAALPRPSGRRPVLVLTRTAAIPRSHNVTIAPLTRTDRRIPSEVPLTPGDGVPTECVVSLENILTVPKKLLASKITGLRSERIKAVFESIRFVFAMPE